MGDRATKLLLLLVFLALVCNAFLMVARPVGAQGQVGRYAIAAYGYYHPGDERGYYGYYRLDTVTGHVQHSQSSEH